MKAALLEFELESATQNVGPFYAGHEVSLQYLTREAVCSALTYTDTIWHDKAQAYQPLVLPFESTPAEPAGSSAVRITEVVYKAGDDSNTGLLRFGRQTVLLPGSRFRCALWGELPVLGEDWVFLIGKKRAPARIVRLQVADVEPNTTSVGTVLPIQVAPDNVMNYPAFVPLAGTQRYFIVRLALTPSLLRFEVGGYIVPLP